MIVSNYSRESVTGFRKDKNRRIQSLFFLKPRIIINTNCFINNDPTVNLVKLYKMSVTFYAGKPSEEIIEEKKYHFPVKQMLQLILEQTRG